MTVSSRGRSNPSPVRAERRTGPARAYVPGPDEQQRSEVLKERVYVTFTALAVIIAYERDAEHASVKGAALTLSLTVLGTLLAVFVADVIAHMVRHSALPSRPQLAHLLYVSLGSLAVLVVPLAILGLSATDVVDLPSALRAIAVALVVSLVVATLFAVRRLRVAVGLKILVLASVTGLGLLALDHRACRPLTRTAATCDNSRVCSAGHQRFRVIRGQRGPQGRCGRGDVVGLGERVRSRARLPRSQPVLGGADRIRTHDLRSLRMKVPPCAQRAGPYRRSAPSSALLSGEVLERPLQGRIVWVRGRGFQVEYGSVARTWRGPRSRPVIADGKPEIWALGRPWIRLDSGGSRGSAR